MKREIIFVRHGTTNSNQNGLLHGRTDVPLGPLGVAEARQAAQRIARIGGVEHVISSPLERAFSTATEIGNAVGVPPVPDPRLIEFNFGDLEGLSFDDLQTMHPELYLSMIDPDGFAKPFPNGESRSELHERVVSVLHEVAIQRDAGRSVVVAHLIVIATAIAHLTSGDPNDAVRYLVRNGSISHLKLNGDLSADVVTLDDIEHLIGQPEGEGV